MAPAMKKAKQAMKRAASASPSPVRGGKRAKAALDAKMDRVVATLNSEYEAATLQACEMLATGAPFALGLVVEDRHAFHETIVRHIREVLAEKKTRLDAAVIEEKQNAKETGAALEQSAAAQTAASAALEAAEAAVAEQRPRVEAAVAEFNEAEQVKVDAQDKVWASETERHQLQNQREKWTDCKPWKALSVLEADVPEKKVQQLNASLAKILTGLGAEQTLLIAVEKSLSKPAADRGDFDAMTLKWVTDMFDAQIAKIDAEVKECEAQEAECQKATDSAAAIVSSKETVKTQEEERLAQLEAVKQEKKTALADAKKSAKDSEKAYAKFEKGIREAEEEVTEHAEVLEAFEFLAARSSAPPPPSPKLDEEAALTTNA